MARLELFDCDFAREVLEPDFDLELPELDFERELFDPDFDLEPLEPLDPPLDLLDVALLSAISEPSLP